MSEESQDEFEAIISGQVAGDVAKEGPDSPWAAIKASWPNYSDGIPVNGVSIVEYVDDAGDRCLRWEVSPDATEWHVLGMLHSALGDLNAGNLRNMLFVGGDDSDDE